MGQQNRNFEYDALQVKSDDILGLSIYDHLLVINCPFTKYRPSESEWSLQMKSNDAVRLPVCAFLEVSNCSHMSKLHCLAVIAGYTFILKISYSYSNSYSMSEPPHPPLHGEISSQNKITSAWERWKAPSKNDDSLQTHGWVGRGKVGSLTQQTRCGFSTHQGYGNGNWSHRGHGSVQQLDL